MKILILHASVGAGHKQAAEEIVGICSHHPGVDPSVICERRRKNWVRAVTAWELDRHAGRTQQEIAAIEHKTIDGKCKKV